MKHDKPKILFNIYNSTYGTNFAGNVFDSNGISPAVLTMGGVTGNR